MGNRNSELVQRHLAASSRNELLLRLGREDGQKGLDILRELGQTAAPCFPVQRQHLSEADGAAPGHRAVPFQRLLQTWPMDPCWANRTDPTRRTKVLRDHRLSDLT